ncbi:cytochrome P450 71D8-like [Prosopis cineraria]|uniref:cytochrome P450 71D8-like n=1 Tax=Prosopis cineraria TaxID=364024 RepID=UPI00240FD6D2|nr:cytochrome P450 71D8-like [Prosopis cineraria]
METQFCFLLLVPFLFILFFFLGLARPKINKAKIEIPGPWKLPLLGNLHQLIAASSSSPPHHTLRDLSLKYGPLIRLQIGEISTVVVSSPDMAKEIMKTHDLAFVHRPQISSARIFAYGATDIAFAPYGEYWRQMKKICILELLSAKKVQSFSYIRQDEVSKLIVSVGSSVGSVVDLTAKIYSLTCAIVTRVAFGNEQEELLQLFYAAIEVAGFRFVDFFPSLKRVHLIITAMEAKLVKIHKKIDKILEDILKENQKKQLRSAEGGCDGTGSGEENLVQVLLRIQRSGSLDITITNNNIKAVIWDMFGGGTDTSATTTEWALLEMMRNPKVMKKAQAEIRKAFKGKKVIHESDMEKLSYLKLVIKETLRLHPPAPLLLPRECTESCKINGYDIPIKTQVIVNAWAIGRDPNHWYEAERFIPERFHGNNPNIDFRGTNFEYIPFGAGRRICPGITFGLASIELPLASLLYHFDWEIPYGMRPEDLDLTETFGITARRKDKLCLIPKPYSIQY